MRSRDEVLAKLREIEAHPSLELPPATLKDDPGRALVQAHLEAQAAMLRWVLGGSLAVVLIDAVRMARRTTDRPLTRAEGGA